MSILSNLLFYLVGMWLQKLILISERPKQALWLRIFYLCIFYVSCFIFMFQLIDYQYF